MMPNTRVNPAASKNSRRPNCNPFRHCSMKRVMMRRLQSLTRGQANGGSAPAPPPPSCQPGSLHRALVVEAILVVLDDGGDRPQHVVAFRIFHRILKVEILDRNVVV